MIGKLLSFVTGSRNSVNVRVSKASLGGGEIRSADHYSTPNTDSHPLPDDFVVTVTTRSTGRTVAVGYTDPSNAYTAQAGEHRLYARNTEGAQVVELHLKNDGSATLSNGSGFITLRSSGTLDLNGVTINPNGDVVIPDSLVLDGREINNHTHAQGPDSNGDTEQDTGPNL